ncbi:hypothetical protein OSB04_002791 [Centaurea solstitialis]|uniref:SWIM-type domain-containing protein n=1 Tax=Centaurea solstitialis TaxID=347529 RepID=A0AA38WTE5_9ASTR|nr:hypothetical protein OSB04_002791 [Centaurea solstitialis]
MTLALDMKFLEEGFEFKTVRSSNSRYEAICVHDNYGWRIYATLIGRSEMFQVRKLNDVHTCSRTQMHPAHRQATRRVLAHLLLDKTGDISRTIRGCDIVKDIKTRYKIDLLLASLACKMESFMHDRGCHWKVCKLFLCPWMRGTMFPVVAMDANNQVVPIAIGVAKSESGESCLVFMTDRSGPLRQAINPVYPTAYHAYCCRHLYMNIKAKDASVEYNKKIFWKTCRAYTTYKFDLHMSALRAAVPGAELLDRVNPTGAIVGLMEYFRAFQQEWCSKRRELAALLTNTLTPWAEVRVQKRVVESASWIVRDIGYGEYEVQDGYKDAKVQYYDKSCSCKRWQLYGLPCGHAIVVAAMQNLTDCNHLASPYFTVENLKATWAPVIYPVGPQLAWTNIYENFINSYLVNSITEPNNLKTEWTETD